MNDIDIKEYEDIISLPRHVSSKRTKMKVKDRAAQFAPFSAVVGHETAVKEAARLTEKRRDLDELEKAIINDQLGDIESQLPIEFDISFVYFQPDDLKQGGSYIEKTGRVKKIDTYTSQVCMMDGTRIDINEILSIDY